MCGIDGKDPVEALSQQAKLEPVPVGGSILTKRAREIGWSPHKSGAIQVWIDLDHRSVELVQPDRSLRFYNQDETLIIDSLPGFALELKTLFAF